LGVAMTEMHHFGVYLRTKFHDAIALVNMYLKPFIDKFMGG
jgi:hypothetical protein